VRRWLRPLLRFLEIFGWQGGRRRRAPALRWDIGRDAEFAPSRLDWWEELTGRHRGEVEFLLRLSEQPWALPQNELIAGIGYTPIEGWRPLVLLDAERLKVPPEARPSAPEDIHLDPREVLYGPLSDIPDAFVMPVGRAEPLSGLAGPGLVGEIGSRDYGTEGIRVVRSDGEDGWRPGFLTAGHAVPGGEGTAVVKLPQHRLMRQAGDLFGRRWARRVGTVAVHNSPPAGGDTEYPDGVESPGFDFAIVDLDQVDESTWSPSEFTSQLRPAPQTLQYAERLAVIGGVSGFVDHVSVNGALFAAEGRWKDCWMLGPTSALQQGDSGSTAFAYETGETFGMVVGATVGWGETHHLYVQSLERLMVDRLTPNVRISPERTI